ncbi:MAG: hypothetical protein JO317_08145, partial [Verrucomicrobiae bacterium]|nr:hypothetical protein [Verrucomicrobiae bacterium]
MLKNLSSVLVLVALGYVGYLANQYFANPSSSAATTAAAAAAPATNAPVPPPPSGEMLILQKDVNAYDPVDPTKIRGKFVKGTQLEIGAQSSTAHMWHVVYRPSSTNWFMLLC